MRGKKIKEVEVESYHIEAVYMHGIKSRLDRLLSEAAGRLSDHSGVYLLGDLPRDLVWDFELGEFNLALVVANRMVRVSPKIVTVHLYINYKDGYNSTRLIWSEPDKERQYARGNQSSKEGSKPHEENSPKNEPEPPLSSERGDPPEETPEGVGETT